MQRWTVRAVLSAALVLASLAAHAAKPVYKVEIVPTQNGMVPLFPEEINNHGVVFGRARSVENHRLLSLFLHDQGTTTLVPDSRNAIPESFNDAGDMLVTIEGDEYVYWHDGRREEIDLWIASAINNLGQVAGAGSNRHAALLSDGTVTDLGTLGGPTSFASEISDAGHVTGSSEIPSSKPDDVRRHGFIWFQGQMKDLGTFGGQESYTLGVNNQGHVIGMATNETNNSKAYFYDGVEMRRLPPVAPGMFPMDINNADEIVGISDEGAFVTTGGRSYLLKNLIKDSDRWNSVDEGLSINDAGDILGTGMKDGHRRTFIARRIRR